MNHEVELVVSPYSTCYMVKPITRTLCWSLPRTDDVELRRLRSSVDSEYIDVREVDGTLKIFHFSRNFRRPKEIAYDNLRQYATRNIAQCKTRITDQEVAKVDESGVRAVRQSQVFQIFRRTFQIHRSPNWYLQFCEYRANWISGDNRFPIRVHHMLDISLFDNICSTFGIRDNWVIDSDIWLHRILLEEMITLEKNIDGDDDADVEDGVYTGLMMGHHVTVNVYPNTHVFSPVCRKLWSSDQQSNNILSFYGAHIKNDQYLLAHEFCVGTFYKFLHTLNDGDDSAPLQKIWIDIFSGVVNGLSNLHKQGICHTNLKPWNVMLTADYEVKISGLDNCEEWNNQRQADDLYDLGCLIVFCYNKQRVSKEDYMFGDVNGQYQTMFDWAYEAKDIALKLLTNPQYALLETVIMHPVFWDKYMDRRGQFIDEANSFMKNNPKYELATWNAKGEFYTGQMWTTDIPDEIVKAAEVDPITGNQINYRHAHPCDLLRFIRNVFNHHAEIRKAVKHNRKAYKFLGKNREVAENSFRVLFPKLVLGFYKFFGDNIANREDLQNLERFYYSYG